jgi:nitroreductase
MNGIKQLVPYKVKVLIISLIISRFKLNKYYRMDKRRYKKSALFLKSSHTKENLESLISIHYHSIEKGLSNPNFRPGFGRNAINGLINGLKEHKKNYGDNSFRYMMGLGIIEQYIKKHENLNYNIDWVLEKASSLEKLNVNLGGSSLFSKEELLSDAKLDFKHLSESRVSVRNYSSEEPNIESVENAIEIAMKTPSVCNRQEWNVVMVKSPEKLSMLTKVHNGLKNDGENLQLMLVVTTDNNFFKGPEERNQGYIDGGMFAMSLLYALHYKGLATCAINANLDFYRDKEIRSLLDIKEYENIVLFIAVGNYPDNFKSPVSKRMPAKNIIREC